LETKSHIGFTTPTFSEITDSHLLYPFYLYFSSLTPNFTISSYQWLEKQKMMSHYFSTRLSGNGSGALNSYHEPITRLLNSRIVF
jgi:hypothetical protein